MDDLEAKPLIGERRVERDDGVFEIKPGRPRIIQGWRLRSYALVSNSTHSSAPTYSSGASLEYSHSNAAGTLLPSANCHNGIRPLHSG